VRLMNGDMTVSLAAARDQGQPGESQVMATIVLFHWVLGITVGVRQLAALGVSLWVNVSVLSS